MYQQLFDSSTTKILIAAFIALLTACSTEDTVSNPAASCNDQVNNAGTCTDPDNVPAPDPVNNAPTTTPVILAAIGEDSGVRVITQVELLANANDADGDALTAAGLAIASGAGTLVANDDGSWNYTPALNDDTGVSFTYSVTDGAIPVATTASLNITPVNDAPTTADVILTEIAEDSGIRVITQAELLANANDDDSGALTATGLAITSGAGSLVDNGDGSWNYTPAPNDDTGVSFSYSVTDGASQVAGTARLDITPIPDEITLSWVAPVKRQDGTAILLSDISGYRIYYGVTPNVYPFQVDIDDGSAEQLTLNDMSPGTYYFVLITIDVEGHESVFSEMITKHV